MKNIKYLINKCLPNKIRNKKLKEGIKELIELLDKTFYWSSPFEIIKIINEAVTIIIKNKENSIDEEIKKLSIPFKNGMVGKEYNITFPLPDWIKHPTFTGLEENGLKAKFIDSHWVISGTPKNTGDVEVILQFKTFKNKPRKEKKFSFYINPDPDNLWENRPVKDGIEYPKPDTDSACIWGMPKDGQPGINMVAASKRGRSHAHNAKPRDDDFALHHCPESDWYIIAVADGAGSAEFSRKGSEIACKTAVDFCKEKLKNPENDFDLFLKEFSKNTEKCKNQLVPKAYDILVRSAYKALIAIQKEAKGKNISANLYATTLLLTICKKLPDDSYIILSFNIGDGAIGIISKENGTMEACLNCEPDEGEFGGQTRFVTMSEVFKNNNLINRIHVKIIKELIAIISMTDGISDPKFETSANLNNKDKWIELWNIIKSKLDNRETVDKELLEWLDFKSPGNHDDRTIAILYSHE